MARRAEGRSLRVALIGVGSFGMMVLAQLARLPGVQIVAIADADRIKAREAVDRAQIDHPGLVTDEVDVLLGARPEVVVEATGSPIHGVAHAVAAIDQGCHVVMANAAAATLAGPELVRRARAAGVVCTLAQGDRPALICDLVEWARACGFDVMAAGRGAMYRHGYHQRTPDTVWELFDYTEEEIQQRGYNARNFTSMVDGTQSAMEMAAVANATGLRPQDRGLLYPPCGAERLAQILVPRSAGGVLDHAGTVEVVSSLTRGGDPVENDLRFGVFVTVAASNPFVAQCFRSYGLATDPSGRFASIYRPVQLLGLETPVSVIMAGLLGESTGEPSRFVAEVAAVAKRDLHPGDTLDGIGGHTVYGRLMPATESMIKRVLPVGLAHGRRLIQHVPAGALVTVDAVGGEAFPSEVVAMRPEMVRPPERGGPIRVPVRSSNVVAARRAEPPRTDRFGLPLAAVDVPRGSAIKPEFAKEREARAREDERRRRVERARRVGLLGPPTDRTPRRTPRS